MLNHNLVREMRRFVLLLDRTVGSEDFTDEQKRELRDLSLRIEIFANNVNKFAKY